MLLQTLEQNLANIRIAYYFLKHISQCAALSMALLYTPKLINTLKTKTKKELIIFSSAIQKEETHY